MLNLNLVMLFILAQVLFAIGLSGLTFFRRNLIILLMAIELMLLSINLHFFTFSLTIDDIIGQIFALFILTVAAGESAIGLSIFTNYHKNRNLILLVKSARLKN